MQAWKELRIRWMYWRYRYITRNRQRLLAHTSARRGLRVISGSSGAYPPPARPRASAMWMPSPRRVGRTWLLLIATVIAIAAFQHMSQQHGYGRDVTLVVDLAILIVAYFVWRLVSQ